MTRKLYYEHIYAREFDAEVLSITEHDGLYDVTLNQSLFYPSGGGQPCDLGTIDGIEVVDVHEKGDEIIHVLKSRPENKNIRGVLNWNRRFEFMQQHLGEHLFAGSLYNLHQVHTARMRIEGDNVSIDTAAPVEADIIHEAEALANEAVYMNIPVEVIFPDIDEIKLHARKLPPEHSIPPIRIVKVQGFDYVPCCGLHVATTGQAGLIKVTSSENHKGGTRIYLRCGRAAYRWVNSLYNEVVKAESELVCGYEGINDKILSLKSQIHDLKVHNESIIDHYLSPLSERLIDEAEIIGGFKLVRYIMNNSNQEEVKHMFRLLTSNHDVIAFLAGVNSEGVFLMFGTHKDNKNVDVRPAFKKAISILDGKGGGSSFSAQGYGKNSDRLDDALSSAVSELKIQ